MTHNTSPKEIESDPYGSNLAFNCEECEHSVVAVALENQRGWDERHPAITKVVELDTSWMSGKIPIRFIFIKQIEKRIKESGVSYYAHHKAAMY